MKGIKWHLVNNWEGAGFRSHTFVAQLPNGALVKTTERYLAGATGGDQADDLEHITSALVFVPDLKVERVDDSGEYAALKLEPEPERMALDPRFYRPRIELDEDGRHFVPDGRGGEIEVTPMSATVTVKPARTDPPLDATDYEPQNAGALEAIRAKFYRRYAVPRSSVMKALRRLLRRPEAPSSSV